MPFDSSSVLLERHRSGDPTAFVTLVEGHQGELLRLARGLLGRGSAFEDVVQEAFMRLAQSPPVIPETVLGDADVERAHLSSWLYKVTRNLCMDVIRSETRRKRRERSVAQPDRHTGGILEVEAGDTRQAVERSLGRLPEDQREVLVAEVLEGLVDVDQRLREREDLRVARRVAVDAAAASGSTVVDGAGALRWHAGGAWTSADGAPGVAGYRYYWDAIHPTRLGHAVLAAAIAPTAAELLGQDPPR